MNEDGTATDQTNSQKILGWLEMDAKDRCQNFTAYQPAFLKKDGQIKAKLATQKVCKANPEILDILGREGERLMALKETVNAARTALLTRDILTLGQAVLEEYEALKKSQAAMDFDDLILRTLDLLSGASMGLDAKTTASWVHYKLDQGLEHILIDEAQDTNPEQWQIIEALCDEFFRPDPQNETKRTVFTVGRSALCTRLHRLSPSRLTERA